MSRNILLIDVPTIKERTGLHNNVDEKLVSPEIKTCQDMYLLPALGTAFYNRLLDGVENNNLTSDETAFLDNYLTDCLVYYVMSELPLPLAIQFYNKGAARKTSDNTENPSPSDLAVVTNFYQKRAEYYKERMILFLKQNATEQLFPEYLNPGAGIDTTIPQRNAYTCSIFLDDPYPCAGKTFAEMYQGKHGCC